MSPGGLTVTAKGRRKGVAVTLESVIALGRLKGERRPPNTVVLLPDPRALESYPTPPVHWRSVHHVDGHAVHPFDGPCPQIALSLGAVRPEFARKRKRPKPAATNLQVRPSQMLSAKALNSLILGGVQAYSRDLTSSD